MSPSDFFLFILIVALFFYWLDSIRAKEIATKHARTACKNVLLEFLDDTVSIKKVRLRRSTHGRMTFYREYQFEFSSTGERRYKGKVILLGKYPKEVEMEPYQFNDL